MPYYMLQAAFTPATMVSMVKSPLDCHKRLRSIIGKLGGSLEGIWLAFGDYDLMALCQMPDDETMATLSMAFAADGGLRHIKTTALISWEEGLHAMKRAGEIGYMTPEGTIVV
jgi:uncharacterized protein with GYD domain